MKPPQPRSVRHMQHQHGFALLVTMMLLALLLLITVGLLSISTITLRQSGSEAAVSEARANARMALILAIAELQRTAGPDQRVTARADITDQDWQSATSALKNPFYTYVWDVSGSEMDLSPSTQDFSEKTSTHRPGMKAGHDFTKLPAVLISGNSDKFEILKDGSFATRQYPEGYVTAETLAEPGSRQWASIVPSDSLLSSTASAAKSMPSIKVPVVNLAKHGGYAWWVGDESIKNRIDLGNQHDNSSVAARMLAQRSPINPFRSKLDSTQLDAQQAKSLLTVQTLPLSLGPELSGPWSYSPDLTTQSESLLTDVRSGGLKQDLTYALYNPYGTSMPAEFGDTQPLFDTIKGKTWGQEINNGDTLMGGMMPIVSKLRQYATSSMADPTQPVSIGTNGITPVLSQAQAGIHAAYKVSGAGSGAQFQVYYSVFPSVTLWNPYDVPIRLDKRISVSLARRGTSAFFYLYKFFANYSLQKADGTIGFTENKVFDTNEGLRTGWNFSVFIQPSSDLIIPPGKAMVFSPPNTTLSTTIPAPGPWPSQRQNVPTFDIEVTPGWRPGKGLLFPLDGRLHNVSTFSSTGQLPKISCGMGTGSIGSDNVIWSASFQDTPTTSKRFSYWARLCSQLSATTPYFTAPLTTDTAQDTRGTFPNLLYKYALRMGDDYLPLKANYIHPEQKTLLYPYLANFNPRAIYHSAMCDGWSTNKAGNATSFFTSDGTEISPSLMGALYDYQNASSIYVVPTTDAANRYTYIGDGYLGASEKMILVESSPALPSSYPNAASGSLTSITQFNNSNLMLGTPTPKGGGTIDYLWLATSNQPAFPFGNSVADFRLNVMQKPIGSSNLLTHFGSLAKFDQQNVNSGGAAGRCQSPHFDASFLLNDRFYDRYYFSTVPQQGSYDSNAPLIQSRLIPKVENVAQLKKIDCAENLTLKGGFNVNSTSVAAWEMLLSSSLGVARSGANGNDAVFANLTHASASKEVKSLTQEDAAAGDRGIKLTEAEIKSLAQEIVRQVKRRGPFPSLSAFVNRTNELDDLRRKDSANASSTANDDVRFAGAIQAAIDATHLLDKVDSAKAINPKQFVGGASSDTRIYPGAASIRRSANSHMPGALKQSDILRQIDPVITVRGDTFVVRAFGTSKNADGTTRATAACEAVVQRGIEYLDPSQKANFAPYEVSSGSNGRKFTNQLTPLNQRFGRRFNVTSFQWLPSSDVSKMLTH